MRFLPRSLSLSLLMSMRGRGSRSLSFSLGMRLLESSTKIMKVSSDIVMLVEKKALKRRW